ncbi:transmembrane protein 154 isoform X2 [Sander lucioperca]|uniref:transmembrane protein 154 isoform X2 n=1 Tax=Sander lucioperca TaxID=283035 RepID=UPI00125D5496|nr:transmembrane protein 154 isoform X2 [Sander lucioperca]
MFASGTGSMRGPRVKTPLLLLLLLPLLLTTLTGTETLPTVSNATSALDSKGPNILQNESEHGQLRTPQAQKTLPTVSNATSAPDCSLKEEDSNGLNIHRNGSKHGLLQTPPTHSNRSLETTNDQGFKDTTEVPEEDLSSISILIPVVLVVLIISMIVCGIFIHCRCNQKVRDQELGKKDPYLDGSSTEKVPMPMFEEDVPSVLELEMEELGQWMKKDGKPAEDSKLA